MKARIAVKIILKRDPSQYRDDVLRRAIKRFGKLATTKDEYSFVDGLLKEYRRACGYAPMTWQEAEAAYDAAPSIPISEAEIDAMVRKITA